MSNSDQDFMDDLRREFLAEATHDLDQCEESYLKLEKPELRIQELAKIFRVAHSLKGTGAALGFTDLAQFAHVVEDCLTLLRNNPDLVDFGIISLLLRAGDAFRQRLELLGANNDAAVWDVEELKKEIVECNDLLESKSNQTQKSASSQPEAPVVDDSVAATLTHEIEEKLSELNDIIPLPEMKPEMAPEIVEPAIAASPVVEVNSVPTPQIAKVATPAPASSSASGGGGGNENKSNFAVASIKIDADRVESVLNLVGELVVTKSQLMNCVIEHPQDGQLASIVTLMDKTIRELQDKTLSMRMTPLKPLFIKAQRIVRDTSAKLGKQIELIISGDETEIDRSMVELLADPLMHMVRNSVDHGVETPRLREERGKEKIGKINLTATQEGGRVIVRVSDDGGGLNREMIFKKALEKGLVSPNSDPQKMSDTEVFDLICSPGFSTAAQVTDLSGRGVGMDVVKTNIEKLRGQLHVESKFKEGSTFTISLPLTTSIMDGMILLIDEQQYILPVSAIRELLTLDTKSIVDVSQNEKVLNHRDGMHSLIDLGSFLKAGKSTHRPIESGKSVIIVEVGAQTVAIIVDKVIGQTQVVLKSLGESFKSDRGIAGGAIMGDGKVALVIDPSGIRQTLIEHGKEKKAQLGTAA